MGHNLTPLCSFVFCNKFSLFRTVLLDNKDKNKTSLPKSQIVRKPHSSTLPSSVSGGSSSSGRDRTLNSAISGPSQSSYSGLGPGRGASSVRPHSPGQRAVPRPLPTSHSPSQYQNSRPASQPSQTIEHQHRPKYPSALKSASKPVNTEIMKKTLRSANATGNSKRGQIFSPTELRCCNPGSAGINRYFGSLDFALWFSLGYFSLRQGNKLGRARKDLEFWFSLGDRNLFAFATLKNPDVMPIRLC